MKSYDTKNENYSVVLNIIEMVIKILLKSENIVLSSYIQKFWNSDISSNASMVPLGYPKVGSVLKFKSSHSQDDVDHSLLRGFVQYNARIWLFMHRVM